MWVENIVILIHHIVLSSLIYFHANCLKRNLGVQMLDKKVLIVGTVRNAEKNVVVDLRRIIAAFEPFMNVMCLVIESDSQDKTLEKLQNYSLEEKRFNYISLGNVEPKIPDRIDRLRYCRNKYVELIRSTESYNSCDLIVVADLDGINKEISKESVRNALDLTIEWDALAANQLAKYYDILALRHPIWSPNNWLEEFIWFRNYLGEHSAKRHTLSNRMIRIPRDAPPIEVDSAFGGLCIYKKWVFEVADYSRDIPESEFEIDHVTFSRKAKSQGAKIFILPSLINANWTTHSLNGSSSVLKVRHFLSIFRYFGYRWFKKWLSL